MDGSTPSLTAGQLSARLAETCTDCHHLTRRGTCLEPVAAGLIPAGAGFGIAWPRPTQAATCAGYTSQVSTKAQEPVMAAQPPHEEDEDE